MALDKEAMKERLLKRLAESKAERERDLAHPRDCACGGHGTVPKAQFSCGFEKCEGKKP